jgi:hypothetical protein
MVAEGQPPIASRSNHRAFGNVLEAHFESHEEIEVSYLGGVRVAADSKLAARHGRTWHWRLFGFRQHERRRGLVQRLRLVARGTRSGSFVPAFISTSFIAYSR